MLVIEKRKPGISTPNVHMVALPPNLRPAFRKWTMKLILTVMIERYLNVSPQTEQPDEELYRNYSSDAQRLHGRG